MSSSPNSRSQLSRLIIFYAVGLAGLVLLIAVTDFGALARDLLPLALFVLLSVVVKRSGVHAAPDTLHSLVGIVDLAAIFIFGPLPGAWVSAASSFTYRVLYQARRGPIRLPTFFVSPIYQAGLRGVMGIASGGAYLALGGSIPPAGLDASNAIPTGAAVLIWYVLDNLAWAFWQWLTLGWDRFYGLFRETLAYSILVELVPLPFALVIAVVYRTFGGISGSIFILMAAALVEIAFILQRYADSQTDLRSRSQELAALNEFGLALARAGFNPDRVVELLLEFARRISSGEVYRVELLNAERDRVNLAVEWRGEQNAWMRGERQPEAAALYVSSNPASVRADDLQRQRTPFRVDEHIGERGEPARSALFIPMLTGEQVCGVLSVLSGKPGSFSRIDERNLNLMASQAAVSLENANLYSVERRRALQLAMVSEVGRRVAQFLDLDELLQHVVREICDRFEYSHVHILARNDEDELVFRASTHPLVGLWRERRERLPAGQGIAGRVLATGEPRLVPDVTRDPDYLPGPDSALLDTRSELAVPLTVGHKVLGVLDVQSEQVGRFSDEDLYILRTLAAQLAIAIEDARLYLAQKEEAWYLNVLLQVSQNLADTETLAEALETIVRITPILVGVERCAVFLFDRETQTFQAAAQYGAGPELEDQFYALRFPVDGESNRALTRMVETRAPVMVEDVSASELIDPELARTFDLDSLVVTPLMYRGIITGALVVDQGPDQRRFSQHEIQVLMGIANQAAVAIENAQLNEQAEVKKRLDYELGLARQIQTSFLPACCPEVPGYQLSAEWRAARQVSGDFYDFISLSGDRLGIAIADVSDKGMPAALFMVLTRTLIRAMAIGKPTAQEALERANDLVLADSSTDMFATALYGILEQGTGKFTFSNAGHNPPLWYRCPEHEVSTPREHGIALGIRPNIRLPEQAITLRAGDVLLLYTDGVTDALNPAGEEFGLERLSELLAEHNHLASDLLLDRILNAVYDFAEGTPQFDDMTLVVLKRTRGVA